MPLMLVEKQEEALVFTSFLGTGTFKRSQTLDPTMIITTGPSLEATLLFPFDPLCHLLGWLIPGEWVSFTVFLHTFSSRIPPFLALILAAANLWSSMALLMRRQVASQRYRANFQRTALTSEAWPTMEGKHQNAVCPQPFSAPWCWLSSLGHWTFPGRVPPALQWGYWVLILTLAISWRKVWDTQREWREFTPLLGFLFLLKPLVL